MEITDYAVSEINNYFKYNKHNKHNKRNLDYKDNAEDDNNCGSNKKMTLFKTIETINVVTNDDIISKLINSVPNEVNIENLKKNGLNDEIKINGIIKVFKKVVECNMENKFIDILNNNTYLHNNYTEFLMVILYYDNLSFLKIFKNYSKKNISNNFIRFCAYTCSICCLDYLLKLKNIYCKIMIINNLFVTLNYDTKDQKKGNHGIMFDIIYIACERGNISILKKYIVEKKNIQSEIDNYNEELNIISKSKLKEYINDECNCDNDVLDNMYKFNILYFRAINNILRMNDLEKSLNEECIDETNNFIEFINTMEKYNIPAHLTNRSYSKCAEFYDININKVANIYDVIKISASYSNKECFQYFLNKFNPKTIEEVTTVNLLKKKLIK
jgi:hypothetical protein